MADCRRNGGLAIASAGLAAQLGYTVASWSGCRPWSAPVRSRWPAPNACRPPGCRSAPRTCCSAMSHSPCRAFQKASVSSTTRSPGVRRHTDGIGARAAARFEPANAHQRARSLRLPVRTRLRGCLSPSAATAVPGLRRGPRWCVPTAAAPMGQRHRQPGRRTDHVRCLLVLDDFRDLMTATARCRRLLFGCRS